MNSEKDFLSILANLSRAAPMDLDAVVFEASPTALPNTKGAASLPVSSALWDRFDDGASYIGVRLTSPVADAQYLASRLAAIAVERRIVPIFMSHIGTSGMQRFGFRVEHISGNSEAERISCEDQIKRFWQLAIVVDATDIEKLG